MNQNEPVPANTGPVPIVMTYRRRPTRAEIKTYVRMAATGLLAAAGVALSVFGLTVIA